MKQRIYKIALIILMVLILGVMGGCNKEEKNPIDNPETEQAETETQEDNAQDEKETEDVTDEEEAVTPAESEDKSAEDKDAANDQETQLVLDGGIKDVYEQVGITAGTCLSDAMIKNDNYANLITENFTSITLENFMKPDYILDRAESVATGDIVVTFPQRTTELLDWAKSKGMALRGHTLVWYSQTPDWIFYVDFDKSKGLVDRDTMLARMESYIKQVFEKLEALGYLDMFYSYDVVNEALLDDGSYRDSLYKQIIGDDYIWHAFNFADKYAPESVGLFYNDFNEQFKTQAVVKLAQSLVDDTGRSLIDGIGCQGHLYTKDSIDKYMQTLKAFSALGLDVQITELDVSLGTWQNIMQPTEENLKAQGQYYYELVSRIVEENAAGNTAVSVITFWGFADHLSWRRDRSPLLFDKDLAPKYSYYGAKLDYDNAGY
ncbi:endo-1,4-beta-xylanase [Mobilitalea sibirica]|uniref:Beta-xylanase n=1 Tax=Mobilitalea sibirica TaxID=1462919 RepID=A0A8J7H4C4_9FIRM|nr:endo-1,4-beta-xylanase [Mobilitalea sibirica]MBH1939316.1 endo-1,4-beta-xylanase [Mobilitalea sibirica]